MNTGTEQIEHVVIWNGAHHGEDRDLFRPVEFAEVEAAVMKRVQVRLDRVESPTRLARRADYEARIWRVLRADQWRPAALVVKGSGLTDAVVSWALRRMVKQGRVERSQRATKCFGKYMCVYRRAS